METVKMKDSNLAWNSAAKTLVAYTTGIATTRRLLKYK